MRSFLVLTSEEVLSTIPYAMVCMTRYGSHWNTGRRKRLWNETFTEREREAASRLFLLSYTWTLTAGVPNTDRMTPETFALWAKLGSFCASI